MLLTAALCSELPAGDLPEWVELIPAGPEIVGQDGRRWLNDRPDVIVQAWQGRRHAIPTVIDYEHATQRRAEAGLPAPAAGWVTALENRAGAIWGQVEWTPVAAEQIRQRQYRFLSPAFKFEKGTGRIAEIETAGLTNTPNLLIALNQQEPIPSMTIPTAVLAALGLAEGATEEQAIAAANTLKSDLATATNRAESPSLERFVPRTDYDAALARATTAEQKLATERQAKLDADIDAAITGALRAGKIAPATKEFYVALCRREGGLAEFQKFLEVTPVIVPGDPGSGSAKASAPADGDTLKAQCAREWNSDESLRRDFDGLEAYTAYARAVAAGRVHITGGTK